MTLLLLYGATGVGKSTVLKILKRNLGFSLVRVYTTRPARHDDDGKISITECEFDDLLKKSVIFVEKRPLGTFRYGESKEDLEAASQGSEPWALDMGIRYYELYRRFRPIDVVLDPPTPEALVQQLTEAKRLDRLSTARDDVAEIEKFIATCGATVVARVRSETGKPEVAARACAALIRER